MLKMNESNDNKNKNSLPQSENKISYIIPLSLQKKRDNSFPQKGKEFMKKKNQI